MESTKEMLMKIRYKSVGFYAAIVADILYLLNVVLCAIMFFRIDTSTSDGQFLKERGLTNYVWEYYSQQVLFKVSVVVLVIAVIALFVSYLLERTGKKRIAMAICFGIILVSGLTLFLMSLDFSIRWRISVIGVIMELISLILIVVLSLVAFILFVIDREYRREVLILLASGAWFLLGILLITLAVAIGIVVIVFKVISIFSDSSTGERIIEEKDEYGNVIRRWREER
ncbi:MAG: hypothetical protein E7264_06140 [Lachnospiraceae bacterium]|nr:hypothetical protein [Lachnospiraceae bacterium]